MTVDEILARVAQCGGRLLTAGEKLHVDAPEGSIPSELLGEIRTNKQTLLAHLQGQQQMCFNLVRRAIETVAEHYPTGCLDALSSDDRAALREVQGAMEAAALGGDIETTEEKAAAYVGLWRRLATERALVTDVLSCTVDGWCARPDRPTIVLDTPHGEVLLVADRAAHAGAIEAGQVVLSPLEVEQLLEADGKQLVNPQFIRALIATKRAMPGARLEQVRAPGEAECEGGEPATLEVKLPRRSRRPRPPKVPRPEPPEPPPAEEQPAQLSLLANK
jgi:hypothetical protein